MSEIMLRCLRFAITSFGESPDVCPLVLLASLRITPRMQQIVTSSLPARKHQVPPYKTDATMRSVSTVVAGLLSFGVTTQALTVLDRPNRFSLRGRNDDLHVQRPIFDSPGPAMPPSTNPHTGPSDPDAGGPGTVILSDVMGRDRSINIFAGLVRDVESVSKRLDDAGLNSTVLAPLNSAMEKMSRKPWEDSQDYDKLGAEAYEGDEGWERAQRNIRRFVEAHVVPVNPWIEGDKVEVLGGGQVWWESKDGVKVVSDQPYILTPYTHYKKVSDERADSTWKSRGGQCC